MKKIQEIDNFTYSVSLEQIKRKWKKDKIFKPKLSNSVRKKLLNGWKLSVNKTLL